MAGLFSKGKSISTSETKIGALRIQNSSQGLPVPIIFGTTRVTSNLLWYGDFTAIPHTETQKTGGKGGGGSTSSNTSYTYTAAFIAGLCEGPVFTSPFVGRIWSNKIVTDASSLNFSEFDGSYSQAPWSYLVSAHANEVQNYRGDCYVASSAFDLGSNDGIPNLSFEVTGLLGSGDINTANVINEMLTADKFGVGWPATNMGNLTAVHDYCQAEGFAIAPAYVSQTPMSSILTELCQIANTAPVWSDNKLKFIPYADTTVGGYTPDLTVQYDLGLSDFMCGEGEDPVKFDRKRQADSFNRVTIECLDRNNQYNLYVAEQKDQLAISLYGLRPMEQITAHSICDPNIANKIARVILQRSLFVRNVYSFKLGWRYCRLEPMDIVSLTEPSLFLNLLPVRILTIEEDENGFLSITAEQLTIGVSTPAAYNTQGTGGSTPANNVPPGNVVSPIMFQPPIALSAKPQVWAGATGGPNWGGAQVWASSDNISFENVGALNGPARIGVLGAILPLVADPDTTSNMIVNMSASNGVADAGGTLSYVAGANGTNELVAYSNTVLTAPNIYSMTQYIRRGQDGSDSIAHANGSAFMRLDEAVSGFDISPTLFGTTIYVKFLSYNTTGNALQALSDVNAYTLLLQTQVVTSGSGYPFYADRLSVANSDPGSGKVRFNNVVQASATQLYFDNSTAQGANMVTLYNSFGNTGFIDIRDVADTNKWATYKVTAANSPTGYHTFNVTYQAGGAEFPNGDTLTATFSAVPPTGVTSVGLNMPAGVFATSNTPITANGTLSVTFVTQNAGTVLAGPVSGNAAAPTFRKLTTADLPPAIAANLTINNQAANYTLTTGDFNAPTFVHMNNAAALILTVPSNANVSVPVGQSVLLARQGAGNVTVLSQANVTVHNSSSNSLRVQFSPAALVKVGADEWNLFGDLT